MNLKRFKNIFISFLILSIPFIFLSFPNSEFVQPMLVTFFVLLFIKIFVVIIKFANHKGYLNKTVIKHYSIQFLLILFVLLTTIFVANRFTNQQYTSSLISIKYTAFSFVLSQVVNKIVIDVTLFLLTMIVMIVLCCLIANSVDNFYKKISQFVNKTFLRLSIRLSKIHAFINQMLVAFYITFLKILKNVITYSSIQESLINDSILVINKKSFYNPIFSF